MNLAQYKEMQKLMTDMAHPRKAKALAQEMVK
jgi:hypothetical protein